MPKIMKTVAVAAPVLTAVFAVLYQFFPLGVYLSLAITFGTIAYHFVMRLIVGLIYHVTMRNRANYNAAYFRQRSWEKKLYQALHVKQWKGKMPTYSPENFDPTRHSWDEIAQAMCQAERRCVRRSWCTKRSSCSPSCRFSRRFRSGTSGCSFSPPSAARCSTDFSSSCSASTVRV
nr:hypothetical protein [uncultured Ruminococcus sp.]